MDYGIWMCIFLFNGRKKLDFFFFNLSRGNFLWKPILTVFQGKPSWELKFHSNYNRREKYCHDGSYATAMTMSFFTVVVLVSTFSVNQLSQLFLLNHYDNVIFHHGCNYCENDWLVLKMLARVNFMAIQIVVTL